MNEIGNKFLLSADKFMPEMNLKEPGFTYSACGLFTRNKHELDKACFQHDMAYGKYKDLEKRTPRDEVLKDKPFAIANNPKHDGYQRGLASMVYKFFDKRNWH